ncbi:uncharacterized protein AAEQ78_000706 [Lycaon pictus]
MPWAEMVLVKRKRGRRERSRQLFPVLVSVPCSSHLKPVKYVDAQVNGYLPTFGMAVPHQRDGDSPACFSFTSKTPTFSLERINGQATRSLPRQGAGGRSAPRQQSSRRTRGRNGERRSEWRHPPSNSEGTRADSEVEEGVAGDVAVGQRRRHGHQQRLPSKNQVQEKKEEKADCGGPCASCRLPGDLRNESRRKDREIHPEAQNPETRGLPGRVRPHALLLFGGTPGAHEWGHQWRREEVPGIFP